MTDAFTARMAALDAVLERCRGTGVFATGIVRDTSNRSRRDMPWWGVQIERTRDRGADTQRITAEIRLSAPAPGIAEQWQGSWRARIWQGSSADSYSAKGGHPLDWHTPSPPELEAAMAALLHESEAALRSTG